MSSPPPSWSMVSDNNSAGKGLISTLRSMPLARDSLPLASLTSSLLNRSASSAEHPAPPGTPLCGLLSLSSSRPGLYPLWLLLDCIGGFCRLLGLRCGELAHGHGLLHDDLVFAAVLVPKIGHFIPELRYECGTVRVYPFVLSVVYPSPTPRVHVDIYTTIIFLFMRQGPASHPFADGSLGHPERPGCFLDGKAVYPSSIPFVHGPILDH